ncbi:MAG: hypothetical protein ACLPTQ_25305 [Terriglobales bacterium]
MSERSTEQRGDQIREFVDSLYRVDSGRILATLIRLLGDFDLARYSTARPQAQRSRKGFVHRLLGKIEIIQQSDQRCPNSSRILAIKGVEQFAYLPGGMLGHDDDLKCRGSPATAGKSGVRRQLDHPADDN